MPMLNNMAKLVMKPVPRMLSAKPHSIADLVVVGSFFAGAALFWQSSKRASIAGMVCGVAELAVSLLTDYPGGSEKSSRFAHIGTSISDWRP
jgi:hypothetical protein